MAFWFVRLDVKRKMSEIEEENVDTRLLCPAGRQVAGVTSRISDEEIGHFSPQKVDKIMRQGYIA